MNALKFMWLKIMQWANQAWSLPKKATISVRHWRRQAVLKEHETERLDRIRNPSKYRGM